MSNTRPGNIVVGSLYQRYYMYGLVPYIIQFRDLLMHSWNQEGERKAERSLSWWGDAWSGEGLQRTCSRWRNPFWIISISNGNWADTMSALDLMWSPYFRTNKLCSLCIWMDIWWDIIYLPMLQWFGRYIFMYIWVLHNLKEIARHKHIWGNLTWKCCSSPNASNCYGRCLILKCTSIILLFYVLVNCLCIVLPH